MVLLLQSCARLPSVPASLAHLHALTPGYPHDCFPFRYLEENVGALNVSLSSAELCELEAICPADKASNCSKHWLRLPPCFWNM